MKSLLAAALLALSLAGAALAATPPAATTEPASSIGSTSARLNGAVNPTGTATSWYFEYGPNTGYGVRTPTRSAGSGTSSRNVSDSVSHLASGTAYHFRLVALSSAGTTYGSDQSFTTDAVPVAQTNPALNVAATSATLSGTVDPKGRATNWHFDYGTSASYDSKTATQTVPASSGPTNVSVVLSNLSAGTTYHYRLVASSSVGSATGSDLSFSTPPAVTMSAAALRVVAGNYVTLSGTVSGGQPGVKVTMLAQPFGESTLTPIATVVTGGGGAWSYLAQPRIATTYEASVSGGTTAPVAIGVQPAVSLRLISGGRYLTHVAGATSFAGKLVQFQRLAYGNWVTVKRTRLNASSSALFPTSLLPRGRSTIRVALSINQAGPGYLAGFSRTLSYRR